MDEGDPKPYRTDRTKPKTEFDKHPPSPTCSGTFNSNISLILIAYHNIHTTNSSEWRTMRQSSERQFGNPNDSFLK
jgi:hypothetical protein